MAISRTSPISHSMKTQVLYEAWEVIVLHDAFDDVANRIYHSK